MPLTSFSSFSSFNAMDIFFLFFNAMDIFFLFPFGGKREKVSNVKGVSD